MEILLSTNTCVLVIRVFDPNYRTNVYKVIQVYTSGKGKAKGKQARFT